MRLGFRHTAFQAVCTVLVLCFALGLLERADTVQPVFGEDSVRVPILMYHSILRDSARQGKYVISPAVLAADLDALQEKGYTAVTVSDLLAYVQDGADLPEKPVMLTFDDGYYNNYIYAYQLLKQRGMKAVVSIIGSQTALFTDNGEENAYWSHLRLDRLREIMADESAPEEIRLAAGRRELELIDRSEKEAAIEAVLTARGYAP